MSLFVRLRFFLAVMIFLILLVAFFFYGTDDYILFVLLVPMLSMMRSGWSDTVHTLFALIYGVGFLGSLGVYILSSSFNEFVQKVDHIPLMVNEFSAIFSIVLGISTLTHLAFALGERHDQHVGYGRRYR